MKNAIPILVAVLILSGCSSPPDRDTNTTPQPTTPNDTPTHTSQQAHTSAPAPPKPPAAETAPATISPAPAPVPVPAYAPETAGTVHPGAFCDGGTGVSKTGKPMICAPATDGRNRWQAA